MSYDDPDPESMTGNLEYSLRLAIKHFYLLSNIRWLIVMEAIILIKSDFRIAAFLNENLTDSGRN